MLIIHLFCIIDDSKQCALLSGCVISIHIVISNTTDSIIFMPDSQCVDFRILFLLDACYMLQYYL